MKTNFTITDNTADIAHFAPVGGIWNVEALSEERENTNQRDVSDKISHDLEKQYGFPFVVQLFTERGHEINNELPSSGKLLATRK
jgi:hypothetical protein